MNAGFLEFGLVLVAFGYINLLWGWTFTMNTPPGLEVVRLDLKKMEEGTLTNGAKRITPKVLVAPKMTEELLVGA
ncbi:MAG: hypothetical protein WAO55_06510 [Candidatus Manganitrophaceae bacterium]